jgi:hypothetical protein
MRHSTRRKTSLAAVAVATQRIHLLYGLIKSLTELIRFFFFFFFFASFSFFLIIMPL